MASLRENAVTLLGSVASVDATATGTTSIYTVPVGKVCLPVLAVARCTAFTVGSKATQPVLSLGFTGAGYDDWINSETVTGMTLDDYWQFTDVNSAHAIGAAAEILTVNVETASDADVETYTIYTFGFLQDA